MIRTFPRPRALLVALAGLAAAGCSPTFLVGHSAG